MNRAALPKVTLNDLIALIVSNAQEPVIYISRDGDDINLEVGPDAYAHHDWVLERRHELLDACRISGDEFRSYSDLDEEDRAAVADYFNEFEETWVEAIAEIARESL
ncbi:hypothetical protein [Streptomyces sp. NPDC056061]|uniref:hypothetical protein n=1 Tax=Streptomyces sp. NPDC056061 TaxID=3345700 RepID=UPI0035D57301